MAILTSVDLRKQQIHLVGARDTAVRNLRDMTIAIAIAASAGVGVTVWVSAATIPGTTGSSGSSGTAANQPISSADQSFAQAPSSSATFGAGVAISGGSR